MKNPLKDLANSFLNIGDDLFRGKSLEDAALKTGGGIWKRRTGKIRKWSKKK